MPRKAINGIKEKIFLETINQCYQVGLSNISTKEVATACGVTDTTLFNYFLTKKGWLHSTHVYVKNAFIEKAVCCQKRYESIVDGRLQLFDFFVKNYKMANFYLQYVTLHNITPDRKNIKILNHFIPAKDGMGGQISHLYSIYGTLKYALLLAQGVVEDNEQVRMIIYKTLYGE